MYYSEMKQAVKLLANIEMLLTIIKSCKGVLKDFLARLF